MGTKPMIPARRHIVFYEGYIYVLQTEVRGCIPFFQADVTDMWEFLHTYSIGEYQVDIFYVDPMLSLVQVFFIPVIFFYNHITCTFHYNKVF